MRPKEYDVYQILGTFFLQLQVEVFWSEKATFKYSPFSIFHLKTCKYTRIKEKPAVGGLHCSHLCFQAAAFDLVDFWVSEVLLCTSWARAPVPPPFFSSSTHQPQDHLLCSFSKQSKLLKMRDQRNKSLSLKYMISLKHFERDMCFHHNKKYFSF